MLFFPKYENYKDTGIPWIAEIPEHWVAERGKWLFAKADRHVRPEDDVVTAFRDGQVTLRINRRTEGFTNAIQEHGYQGIRKGDLVIHAMDAFAGAIGVSDSDGKATPVYSACVPRGEYYVNPYYYAYLLRYMSQSGYIQALAKGIRERSTDFRYKDFGELFLPVPKNAEQDRIVYFLDQKTTEIDEAIAKKKRLIELLKERKAILINHAVTKGLNPNAPMRDCGVEWIGGIPAHWKFPRFRYCTMVIKDGLHHTPPKHDEGVNFVSTQHVRNRQIYVEDATYISYKSYKEGHPRVKPQVGDVLITLVGSIGFAAIIKDDHMPLSFTRHVGYVRCRTNVLLQEYLLIYTESNVFKCFIGQNVSKTAQPSIYLSSLASHKMPIPPIGEQKDVIAWIAASTRPYDAAISAAQIEISQLNEMRHAFIFEAVTGKIKI